VTAQIFGNAGIEYMEKYGAKPEHFAEIARINHAHRSVSIYFTNMSVSTIHIPNSTMCIPSNK
jgi:sterol carrier protein 2